RLPPVRFRDSIVAAGFSIFAIAQAAIAQVRLNGVVRDASGGVLPGATISVLDEAPRVVGSEATRADGSFTSQVQRPGECRVRVALPGFEAVERPVQIRSTSVAPLDIVLGLARLGEHVSVRAAAADIDLPSVPRTQIDRQLIDSLPSESVSSS